MTKAVNVVAAADEWPAVSIENINLTYVTASGTIPAVQNLSLSIERGSFVSILGPSGCGKSTVIKVVAGLLRPSAGQTRIGNTLVTGPRTDVGMVFQQPTLLPWKSVLNNIMVPLQPRGGNSSGNLARAREMLDLVKLRDFENSYPHELSGGMQQRVGIARALIHEPPVVVMDEPFAALDALTREQMAIELQRMWSHSKKTVIFVTHSIPEAAFLSDRVVVLSPRPAKVVKDIKIGLPRPRGMDTLAGADFTEVCNDLRRELYAVTGASVGGAL
jgi:NitT/TauT family transport system ATP-binding protein